VSGSIQWAIIRESLWDWLLYCSTAILLIGLLQVLLTGASRPLLEHIQAISRMVVVLFLVLALLLPKFIYNWLQLSHRFVGPVERVRRVLRDLADGKEHIEVQFREDDFWGELADELNSAVRAVTGENSRDRTTGAVADEDTIPPADKLPSSTGCSP